MTQYAAPTGPIRRLGGPASAVTLWLTGIALAPILGLAIATEPRLLVAGGGAVVAGLLVLAVFEQPRWVLVVALALLVSYAIAVLRAQAALPLTVKTLLLLLAIGVLARRVVGFEHARLPLKESGLLAAVGAAMVVSTAFAVDRGSAVYAIVEFAENAALVVLMVMLLDRAEWLRRAAWSYVLAAGTLGFLAAVQQLTGTFSMTYGGFAMVHEDGGLLRSAGPISPNYLAQVLLASAALAAYLALSAKRPVARASAVALALASLAGLAFTFSRGSLLAGAVLVVVVARLRSVSLLLPAGVLVTAAVAASLILPPEARSRLEALVPPIGSSVATVEDRSVRGRFSENLAAVQMFVDHPYLGVGPRNYPKRYLEYSQKIGLDPRAEERQPHNLYLEALAELGVLGAIAFFALLAVAARGAWNARARLPRREALLAEGVFVAVLAFLLNGAFLQASYPHYLWVTVGLALAARRLARAPAGAPT